MSNTRLNLFIPTVVFSIAVSAATAQSQTAQKPAPKPAANSTSAPAAGCHWEYGDGMASGLVCPNANNGSQPGSTSVAPRIVYTAPRTPAGAGYLNALQAFFSGMAPQYTPPPEPEPSSLSSESTGKASPLPASPLIDPSDFANAGKDSISQSMDDLLDHCPEAVQYVESPTGLVGEFDRVFKQYQIKKEGIALIQKVKDDLLNDTWWARSSGPDVAREVKFVADGLNDIFGMLSPGGEVVNGLKQIEDVSANQEFTNTLVGRVGDGVNVIKGAYDRKDNVYQAAEKVAADVSEIAMKEYIKNKAYGRVLPFINFAEHLAERAKTQKEGAEFKVEVQSQLRKLDVQINIFQNQVNDAVKAMNAINALHDAVIGVCVQKSIPVGTGSKN
jgi:hypothetical protein